MQCSECKIVNDPDAAYCSNCGKPVAQELPTAPSGFRKSYLFMVVLVLVVILVAGLGYYKFILPIGIAAVVNGEDIKRTDVDAALFSVPGKGDESNSGLRRRILNQLIVERIVLQEARKAGMSLSEEDQSSLVAEARASSGLDEAAFNRRILARYGAMSVFENMLQRRFLINKFLAQKIAPQGADSLTAGRAVDRWMQDMTGRASVRITLAEQGPGPGCGCCGKDGGPGATQRNKPACGQGQASAQGSPAQEKVRAAEDAGLAFWREKHGPEAVTAKARDFGCHVQVDIIKNEKIISSLRYQNGSITER